MTVAVLYGTSPLASSSDYGLSESAVAIRSMREVENTPSYVATERRNEAFEAVLDAIRAGRERTTGTGARIPDKITFFSALQFLLLLPAAAPFPEVDVDFDGDIAIDWDYGPRRIFSVRVSRGRTLYYAGLIGFSTFHGSEIFGEGIPRRIAEGISEVRSTDST